MSNHLRVTVAREGPAARVRVSGEVDAATAPVLRAQLHDQATDADPVVLDLRNVPFIDSTGLRTLLSLTDEFAGRLQIIPSTAALRLAELTGLHGRLPFVDGER